ncbi:MAG: glycoside hydrolase family 15 protein [Anaerolineales bacterium]
MPYTPIENYGLIGNMHTAALVSLHGSIDWFCYPHFDSPSVFGAILDDTQGGYFRISPRDKDGTHYKQLYWPETNVLVTRFLSDAGIAEMLDFMPIPDDANPHNRLLRIVRVVHGAVDFEMVCQPAFNYARDAHTLSLQEGGAVFDTESLRLALATRAPLQATAADGLRAEFHLEDGESLAFMLQSVAGDCPPPLSATEAEALFESTVKYWRAWLSQCSYTGRWRETVQRSALTMKLLTFAPTGAIVAAPTAGLPETLGGIRNWDYRYTWLRDAAFTLYGFMRIGFTQEAAAFIDWLQARAHEQNPGGGLQIMYGIRGEHELTETTLDHLDGYRGSQPVRVGNAAHDQLQLDIYGELMDAVYLYNKYGEPVSYDLWRELCALLDWVVDNWQRPDAGVWEMRGEPQHFVYSKLMCWVALDRGLRLADKRSFPAPRDRWLQARDAIYEEIMDKGWSDERGAFIQAYGNTTLDASNLIMPLVFFVSPTDPRMLSTIDAIRQAPEDGGLTIDSLVYRYDTAAELDGLHGEEGTFNMCSFWLVEALTRAGRLDEARLMFEQMLSYANHLGLYAEETGPRGEALGNFPQAFTHLALISAAFNLDRALRGG